MTSILTAAALIVLSADTLTGGKMGNLAFKTPTGWTIQSSDEGTTWEPKEKNAKLELSVYPVDPKRDAALCLKQLLEALASDGWAQVKVGAQPAAWKAISDFVGEGDAAKVDKNKVTTVTYVGCNGDTKWVLTMTSPTPQGSRFGPLLKRIVESVKYEAGK